MESSAVWFDAPYQVSVRPQARPVIAPDQVLVQTVVSAISAGTELLFYRGQVPTGMNVDAMLPGLTGLCQYPLQYGYACVGRVVETGAAVQSDWCGRLVMAFQPHGSHMAARPADLIPVPEGMAPEQAVFLPNMETAVNLVMDGAPLIGERVVVLGQGIVGLLTTTLLSRMPVDRLLTFDRFPLRRECSRKVGASQALNPSEAEAVAEARALLGEGLADLTFELSGNPEALNLALALTGYSGRIVIGSWYGAKQAPLALGGSFHRSRIRLISSQVSTIAPDLTGRWTKDRRLDVAWARLADCALDPLLTHRFPVSAAAQAYALLDQHPEQALQVLLSYD